MDLNRSVKVPIILIFSSIYFSAGIALVLVLYLWKLVSVMSYIHELCRID